MYVWRSRRREVSGGHRFTSGRNDGRRFGGGTGLGLGETGSWRGVQVWGKQGVPAEDSRQRRRTAVALGVSYDLASQPTRQSHRKQRS